MIVQLGNKQLKINEADKDVYLSLGYNVVNEKGEVEELGTAVTLNDIKAENASLKSKLAEYKDNSEKLDQFEALQKENEDLKAQVADLAAQLEAANKGKSK